ncbi:unnamed protein product [Euphydryas editha]|uniref:Uncharacterized protein n=1 Tax=Euphydryas editha TaxID=104508 RepID=A0AAU9TYZ6_EUPED|nr:unnamed protein product [Euphydryas editha]
MGLYSQTGSRSFISFSGILYEAKRCRRGGGAVDARPSARASTAIVSSRRRVTNDACLRARSLRYAAGLRRAVTRHVWRDRCCYACAWIFDDTASSGTAQPVSSGAYRERQAALSRTHAFPTPPDKTNYDCYRYRIRLCTFV